MNRSDWEIYAIIRSLRGKKAADEYKSGIRKKERKHRYKTYDNGFRICIDHGMDGYYEKRLYAANLTDADKDDIENDIRIERPYSAYDCTGKAFTSWISFFEVPGGTWCYHRISFDV